MHNQTNNNMTIESLNASLVAAHLTGYMEGEIKKYIAEEDYEKAIRYTQALIRAYTNLEFNSACNQWLREWNQQLEKYGKLRSQGTKK